MILRPWEGRVPLAIIESAAVRGAVSFEDLIDPVARAFVQSSAGEADNRSIVIFPAASRELGDVAVKTGVLHGRSVFIVKAAPWFAAAAQRGEPQGGFIAVLDSHTGRTRALIQDEHYLSDIRTAAAGAIAAQHLAPACVTTALIVGAGTQAYWQARALYHMRRFARLVIWARDASKAFALRRRLSPHLGTAAITVSSDLEASVRDADVVVTATLARDPLLRGEWLHPGQHVTAVGADDPNKCELHPNVLRRARVFVDATETATANGDVHRAITCGAYSADFLAGEIGDVIAGRVPGRSSDADITVAKLVGIGAQDVAAAEVVLARLDAAGRR